MLVENTLVSPLPGLGTLKSGNNSDSYGVLPVGDPTPGSQTPTSSAEPASERIDPVLLLSRPVEGFNHPRQHVFTDRLLGRFYEDSSLDAETRKTSKCLAGRLGTAGSHSTTRPSTTATTSSHFRPSRSPTTTRRGGKRMQSASARALGSSREPGAGLAGRKEQIQKEILEQKALIERLEGRVASLSGRGRRSSAPRGSSAPPQEDRQNGAGGRKQDTADRPTTTPNPESIATQENRGAEYARDGCCSGAQSQSPTEGRERRGSSGSKPRKKSCQEVPDHGPNARRDSRRLSSMSASQSTGTGQQQEERCAVTIQRNVRGAGRRKKFLTLQSAREDIEHHLQTLVSAAATALAQQQQLSQNGEAEQSSGTWVGSEGSLQRVSAAAVRLLETGREDGLAKPPFDILRDMYGGIEDVAGALASLSAGEQTGAGAGAGGEGREGGLTLAASMMESCGAAKEALDAIREAVGADMGYFGGRAKSPSPSAASSPTAPRHTQTQPVGSGRAAAVAMASGRGGLLVSPEEPSSDTCPERVAGQSSSGKDTETGKVGGRTGSGENHHLESVALRTLDAKSVAELLRMNGLEEHAPGFVAQGVDGIMLSDPNLCEADFAELGLGGGGEGGRDSRARMVSLFRRCQQEGAVFSANGGGSSQSVAGKIRQRSGDQCARDCNLDERRENQPNTEQSNLGPHEESSWRRGSALVDRENQRVLAQITLDPSEAGRSGAASSGENENGRRMSVKLNNGVVVTAGGREEGLVDNVDEVLAIDAETEAEAAEAAAAAAAAAANVEKGDDVFSVASGGGAYSANPLGRKKSIGLRTIPLYKEPSGAGEGSSSHAAEDLPLPPSVVITASDATVNVFR